MIRDSFSPIWHSPSNPVPVERPARAPYVLVFVAAVLFAGVFSWLSLARHAAFQSHAFDLGNMDQAVWNTLHGHLLWFTDMSVGNLVLTTRLAIHVEPLLLLAVPLYLIHSGPETLLVLQACVVASGALPAYGLARAYLAHPYAALAFPCAYLLHPSLQNAILDDFHAVTLTAALLLWAIYFLHRDRLLPFVLFALLSIAAKEEVGLIVAALGLWAALRRHWLLAVLSVLAGVGWFLVSVAAIIPHFNPSGHSPYLSRYGYLGHGLTGILRGAVRRPGVVLRTLLSAPRLTYLLDLLHPLGFTSLLAVPVLALALPILLLNMLSADSTMYSGFYQYSAEIVPIVIAASIVGVAWIERLAGSRALTPAVPIAPVLCGFIVLASAVDTWVYGFSPLASGYAIPAPGPHQAIENQTIRLIPPAAVVAAADEIEPHLSDRRWIYLLPTTHPDNGPRARFLVLDASTPSRPVTPQALHAVVQQALHHGYGVRSARDGVLLLQRGVARHTLPASFFTFVFASPVRARPARASWGHLRLIGIVVHPRSGRVNRSRPAIDLETYWRVTGPLPPGTRISFRLSPPYSGRHPVLSSAWTRDGDSPTWDWLPLRKWPRGRTVRADSLGLTPAAGSWGKVDVAITVLGAGKVGGRVFDAAAVSSTTVRVATVDVR